jgi:hypothetical protein
MIAPMRKLTLLLPTVLLLSACFGGNGDDMTGYPAYPDPMMVPYEKSDAGFAIEYPLGWTLEEDSMIVTDEYELSGSAFVMQTSALQSKLFDVRFHVGVQETCPVQHEPAPFLIDSGLLLTRSTWMGVGAGNLYEGITYTFEANDARCYVLTGYIHSCNLEGEECGPDNSGNFNRDSFYNGFDLIAKKFRLL